MNPDVNWFATFALASWPIVIVWLYSTRSATQATLWSFLGAQLLLPVGAAIKLEGVPEFDKFSIPSLAALVSCIFVARRPLRLWRQLGIVELLMLVYVFSPLITAGLNTDPIVLPSRTLPADMRPSGTASPQLSPS
jgi:hypothetical protein